MLQEKLSALSIMYIESEKLSRLSFPDIVNEFALEKPRKRKFLYLN
jgi:hypothetical protein